jgi:DNA-binding GntR family transcriptional regulator
MTARTAALVLQSRNVTVADVFDAMAILEPNAARTIAASPEHRALADQLRPLVVDLKLALDDPAAFGATEAAFHQKLVALAGNQTLAIVAEMLNEVQTRAVTDVAERVRLASPADLRRAIRSKEHLIALLESGDSAGAEEHWRTHMQATRRLLVGQQVKQPIDWAAHI